MKRRTIYDKFDSPPKYYIFVHVAADPKRGLDRPFTSRVGTAETMDDAERVIVEDLNQMSETYGGLIAPAGTRGRTYRVFKAEWIEVSDQIGKHDTQAVA